MTCYHIGMVHILLDKANHNVPITVHNGRNIFILLICDLGLFIESNHIHIMYLFLDIKKWTLYITLYIIFLFQ